MHDSLIARGGSVRGVVAVPGDKSISHRAALMAAQANGPSVLQGFLMGADCLALLQALEALGIEVQRPGGDIIHVQGQGRAVWRVPGHDLDLGNSATALRLLAGVLAGRGIPAVLTGDTSLRTRPMNRIVDPLRRMGAHIDARDGRPPVVLRGGRLHGAHHRLAVASAQVKSCLLFAGLYAAGETWIESPRPTRDHTERMLEAWGIPLLREGEAIGVRPCNWDTLAGRTMRIPGDPSSAAFFAVAAALVDGAEVMVQGIALNPGRLGFVEILARFGAEVAVTETGSVNGEPVGDLRVRGAGLKAVHIGEEDIAALIDELPALLIVAACAEGRSVVTGAGELRSKESDRLKTMADGLKALGVDCVEHPDGIEIEGGPLRGGTVDAMHDHRIAMAFAIASLRASGPVNIHRCAEIDTSFPGFVASAAAAGLELEVV